MTTSASTLPYKIAVLCYLYDAQGRLLLLHRAQEPNKGLYSPIGGKLHMHEGENPAECARREIREEVELDIDPADLHLTGLISETAFNGQAHWLMFLYEVTRPVTITRMTFREGALEWHPPEAVDRLQIPETDRLVIYPLLRKYHNQFFHAHIDCRGAQMTWRIEHPKQR
jgi:8-oxo-dGTP diphosphatase